MSVRSMTGFARVRRTFGDGEIAVSLKSVNHRGLDLHFHLPPALDALENEVRGVIKSGVARGHIQVNVGLARISAGGPSPLNRPLMDAYVAAYRDAAALYGVAGVPDLNAALRLPGMLAPADDENDVPEDLTAVLLETTAAAVAELNVAREREGAAMAADILARCHAIGQLAAHIERIREGAVPAYQKRLREKLAELLDGAGIDPQRIAQEAAILADRSDIAEELVRLRTHGVQLEAIVTAGGEAGKRLDFLLQEMNREANTILSKTGGLGDLGLTITELALAAKSEIDKIREQSLNLE